MKPKRLGSDLRNSRELQLGSREVFLHHSGEPVLLPHEVEEIGDGFQWIVDLVRNGSCEPPHGRQLFTLHQGGLSLLLRSEIRQEDGNLFRRAAVR
jgi:hypothetical protein